MGTKSENKELDFDVRTYIKMLETGRDWVAPGVCVHSIDGIGTIEEFDPETFDVTSTYFYHAADARVIGAALARAREGEKHG